tara:strand:+ start:733 stop:1668 length:936 start_codon:yes stop_codon:yes gene_type:complete
MNPFSEAWALLKHDDQGTMRNVELPEDGPAIKYSRPYRRTKIGNTPMNMAFSQALERMGYPVVGEKPYGYRGDAGYTVSQPQAEKTFPDFPDPPQDRDLSDLEMAFEESPMVNLLTSNRGDLDTHGENVGYFGDELKHLDPMYGPERENIYDGDMERRYNHAIRDIYDTMNTGTPADKLMVEPWKERLRQVREAKDELPEFIEHYKDREMFRPWLDDKYDFESEEDNYVEGPWGLIQRDRDENVDPQHRQQMLEHFGKYRNFGDALSWMHNTVNDPAQTRLYDFDTDPKYKENVEALQRMSQDSFHPQYQY